MSGAAARATRGRRARVILVGDVPDASRIARCFAQQPARAANMFQALGEIAACTAAEPIAALMVGEDTLQPPHQHALEAVRRIDPSVRIIGLTRSAPGPTGDGGVDAWVALPPTAEDLRRALEDDGLLADVAAIERDTPATSEHDSIGSATPIIEAGGNVFSLNSTATPDVEPPPVPARPAPLMPQPAAQSPAPASPPAMASTVRPAEPAAPPPSAAPPASPVMGSPVIGDTDLIHAMLHEPPGLAPLALQLIANYGGWANVRLVPPAADAGSGHAHGARIAVGDACFGDLCADGASTSELRPWAQWLAHWLALEAEHCRCRRDALTDDLTGAWNRRYFERFLTDAISRAHHERRMVTVMVFDIDNFKSYNDQFGHAAGDDILREIVRLLQSVIRQGDCVCRIGGDEFVVVFADPEGPRMPGSKHPESVETIARRFQQQVCSMRFPKLGVEAPGTLSISAGLSTYPWDGQDAESLLQHADQLALESKRKGKNAITLGPWPSVND